jgi:hypothetical protein
MARTRARDGYILIKFTNNLRRGIAAKRRGIFGGWGVPCLDISATAQRKREQTNNKQINASNKQIAQR